MPEGPAGGCRSALVFEESLTAYDFGPSHPMNPVRVDLAVALATELEVAPPMVPAPDATEADLLSIHSRELVEAIERVSADPTRDESRFGLGSDDNPVFARMHEAGRHVVGASLEAARQVWSGSVDHAVNIAGGLHHAMPSMVSGFCVYNDVAAAITWLLARGVERVAYVDVDVHHGDGVERIFYDDPRVLTISLHETGQVLFPGTGFPKHHGGPGAEGSAVNVALPPGTADAGWLRAFHAVVPPLLESFAPQVLVTQHGCDTHRDDPLADLALSVDGQRASYLRLHELAHEVAGGRWVAFGGGGYSVVGVVPRAWTHLLAAVRGTPLAPEADTPTAWRELVQRRVPGARPPVRMTDGRTPAYRDWSEGYDPDTWLDRAVQATREQLFPLHGLDPSGY